MSTGPLPPPGTAPFPPARPPRVPVAGDRLSSATPFGAAPPPPSSPYGPPSSPVPSAAVPPPASPYATGPPPPAPSRPHRPAPAPGAAPLNVASVEPATTSSAAAPAPVPPRPPKPAGSPSFPGGTSSGSVIVSGNDVEIFEGELKKARESQQELTEIVQRKDAQIGALETEVANLKAGLGKALTISNRLSTELPDMKSRMGDQEKALQAKEAQIQAISSDLQQALASAQRLQSLFDTQPKPQLVSELQSRVTELSSQLEARPTAQQVVELQAKVTELSSQLESNPSPQHVAGLQAKVTELTGQVEGMKQDQGKFESREKDLQEQLRVVSARRDDLTALGRQAAEKLAEQQTVIQQLSADLSDGAEALARTRKELAAAVQERAELQNMLQAVPHTTADSSSPTAVEVEALRSRIYGLEQSNQQLESDLETAKKSFEAEKQHLCASQTVEQDQLRHQLQQEKTERESLQAQASDAESQRSKLTADLAQARAEAFGFAATLASQEKAVKAQQAELESVTAQWEAGQQTAQEQEAQLQQLAKRIAGIQESHEKQVSDLQQQLKERQLEHGQALDDRVAENSKLKASLERAQAQLAQLGQELRGSTAEADTDASQLASQSERLRLLEEQRDDMAVEKDKADRKAARLEQSLKEGELAQTQLRAEIDELKANLSSSSEGSVSTERELRKELTASAEKSKGLQFQLDTLSKELETVQGAQSSAQQELATVTQQLQQLRQEHTELAQKLVQSTAASGKLTSELESTQAALGASQGQLQLALKNGEHQQQQQHPASSLKADSASIIHELSVTRDSLRAEIFDLKQHLEKGATAVALNASSDLTDAKVARLKQQAAHWKRRALELANQQLQLVQSQQDALQDSITLFGSLSPKSIAADASSPLPKVSPKQTTLSQTTPNQATPEQPAERPRSEVPRMVNPAALVAQASPNLSVAATTTKSSSASQQRVEQISLLNALRQDASTLGSLEQQLVSSKSPAAKARLVQHIESRLVASITSILEYGLNSWKLWGRYTVWDAILAAASTDGLVQDGSTASFSSSIMDINSSDPPGGANAKVAAFLIHAYTQRRLHEWLDMLLRDTRFLAFYHDWSIVSDEWASCQFLVQLERSY